MRVLYNIVVTLNAACLCGASWSRCMCRVFLLRGCKSVFTEVFIFRANEAGMGRVLRMYWDS